MLKELPQPLVHEELLSNVDAHAMNQNCNAKLIAYLDRAMIPKRGKSAVIDFTVGLFTALDYMNGPTIHVAPL
jgi:hypothetical protein